MIDKKEILKVLEHIFRLTLNDETLVLKLDSSTKSISQWDSITNIVIIDAIESHFNIEFPIDVIYEARNIEDWIDFIAKSQNG
jgi:acyl carrier protein